MEKINELFAALQDKVSTIIDYAIVFGILVVAFLLLGSMFRFLFGKKAQIGKAITSAMEILCLYMVCIVIYSFGLHWELFVNPLPFMTLDGDVLRLFPKRRKRQCRNNEFSACTWLESRTDHFFVRLV